MKKIGIDVGTSCVKIAVMDGEEICLVWKAEHRGKVLETLSAGMGALDLPEEAALRVTGGNAESVLRAAPDADRLEDIPAITEGARILAPSAGSVIEIGSQSSRYVCGLQEKAPRFSVNEHCAGGTGSFFEAQMSRLGMEIEGFNSLVRTAESIPNISGRCAVFAKTDIIHRQQEGGQKAGHPARPVLRDGAQFQGRHSARAACRKACPFLRRRVAECRREAGYPLRLPLRSG